MLAYFGNDNGHGKPHHEKRSNRSRQGIFSHRCLRKASAAEPVITELGGSAGIAGGKVHALETHGGNGESAKMTLTIQGFRHGGHVGGGMCTGKRQRELGDASGGIGGHLGAAVLRRAGNGKSRAIALVEHVGGRLSLLESPHSCGKLSFADVASLQ